MILTFLASFAQEESRSTSENMKWRIKQDFQKGIIWGSKPSLGYELKDKKLTVIQDEADVVRLIYNLYLEGNGDEKICRILDAKGALPKRSKKWNRSSVRSILTNYNYTGDLVLQKTYRENHLTKTKKTNNGEFKKYLVKNNHEAIIDKSIFDAVMAIREARAIKVKPRNGNKSHVFKGMIRCSNCGCVYKRVKRKTNDVWVCSTAKLKGKDFCSSKQVPNNKVIEAANFILNQTVFNEFDFMSKISFVEVHPDNKLIFHMNDERVKQYVWTYESRSKSWTKEMKEEARVRALKQHEGGSL